MGVKAKNMEPESKGLLFFFTLGCQGWFGSSGQEINARSLLLSVISSHSEAGWAQRDFPNQGGAL